MGRTCARGVSGRFMIVGMIAGVALLGVNAPTAEASTPNLLGEWSLIAFENASSNSNNQGRAWIGGNLTGSASDYGTRLNRNLFRPQDILRVGGSIQVSNINMEAGSIRHGGSITGNTNFNGGGQRFAASSVASLMPAARGQLLWNSNFLRQMTATSTLTIPTGQPGPLNFNAVPASSGPSAGVAVFNVSGASVFNNSRVQQMDVNFGAATSIVINVSGTTINWTNGNMIGNLATDFARARIIWNFFEATSINLQGRAFSGAILAPLAHLTHEGVISGSVAVKSIDQRSEIHLPSFVGYIPSPGAAAALVMGGLIASRRRR